MKKLLCLLLAMAMLFALCGCGDDGRRDSSRDDREDTDRGNQIGDLCYRGELTEISENGQALTTFDPTSLGKITVINFWAYWCGPCVNELPHFNQVAEEYGDEVAIIAVHCDQLSKAQDFIRINYPDSPIRFAMDSNKRNPYAYYETLGGTGSIPFTVVLDANGIVRQKFVGAINYNKLKTAVEACKEDA